MGSPVNFMLLWSWVMDHITIPVVEPYWLNFFSCSLYTGGINRGKSIHVDKNQSRLLWEIVLWIIYSIGEGWACKHHIYHHIIRYTCNEVNPTRKKWLPYLMRWVVCNSGPTGELRHALWHLSKEPVLLMRENITLQLNISKYHECH